MRQDNKVFADQVHVLLPPNRQHQFGHPFPRFSIKAYHVLKKPLTTAYGRASGLKLLVKKKAF